MTPTKHFSKNLQILRKSREISQEELGFRCGLHRTEISLLEREGREPRLDTLVKLSEGLGAPVSDLLLGIGWHEDAAPAAASTSG